MKLSKGRATGYSDFYNKTSVTPGTRPNKLESAAASSDDEDDSRKEAIRRRLKKFRKAGN